MHQLLWKVCGMREPENIRELIELSPDFIGFIFYDKSSRYVRNKENFELIRSIPSNIRKVGVFVNESFDCLIEIVEHYQLDFVQLHGGESVDYCEKVKEKGIRLFKVFSVESQLNYETIKSFDGLADYFLFDTKTDKYGGSGKKFNWEILKGYKLKTPYILSGGISIEDIQEIDRNKFPGLAALDVNSKFELKPALKNISLLKELKNKILSNNDSYESIGEV